MSEWTYTFLTDDGQKVLTHAQYLQDPELRKAVTGVENARTVLNLGRTIMAYSQKFLDGDRETRELWAHLKHEQMVNPLQFYAPNCQEHLDFINDDDHDVCAVRDPHRTGKTTAAFIKMLVNVPLVQCDPTWPIFTEHGVKYKPWVGPTRCGLATYDVRALEQVVWQEMIRRWMPDADLGDFARVTGTRFSPSMDHQYGHPLPNGGYLGWFTYAMDPGTFEVSVFHAFLWDEQGRRAMFNGIDRGMRTTRGRHFFSLTPYSLKGRPDTGAGSWLHELLSGKITMGHKIKEYFAGDIRKTPDWIYPDEEKDKEFIKWDSEPRKCVPPNKKMLAEGRARLFGEWHKGADIVLDQWDSEIHWIKPLWVYPPEDWTLYRAIDHGGVNPTVCVWCAVNKDGIAVAYRAMYSMGKTIHENVAQIVAQSGNVLVEGGHRTHGRTGRTIPLFREEYYRESIFKQVMDSRSFSFGLGATELTLGETYKAAGLTTLDKASGKRRDYWVPILQEMLCPDPKLKHIITGQPGGCHLYIFDTPSCVPLRREIEQWVYELVRDNDTKNESEKPREKDDHGPSALGYMAQIPLRYVGGMFGRKLPQFDSSSLVAIRAKAARRKIALRRPGGYRPL